MKNRVIIIIFIVLAVLHQDFWNWSNGDLVFGVMPVALAYHAAYSLIAALFWTLVIKFAWPVELEAWADGEDPPAASVATHAGSPGPTVGAGAATIGGGDEA